MTYILAPTHVDEVPARWCLPRGMCQDLAKLALFDIILFIDNSASIALEEAGERIKDPGRSADARGHPDFGVLVCDTEPAKTHIISTLEDHLQPI